MAEGEERVRWEGLLGATVQRCELAGVFGALPGPGTGRTGDQETRKTVLRMKPDLNEGLLF